MRVSRFDHRLSRLFSSSPPRPQRRAPDLSGHCRTSARRQNECLKRCQNRCHIECQIECQSICQEECQIEGQKKYAIYTSRWYVRNYVRLVFQGGGSLEESNLGFWCFLPASQLYQQVALLPKTRQSPSPRVTSQLVVDSRI